MNDSPEERAAAIAGLLNKLADLSGEEAALEACRREADAFDGVRSTAEIALLLLDLETEPAGREEVRADVERLRAFFEAGGELSAAALLARGLEKPDAAEGRP